MYERETSRGLQINIGYAHFQIAKALTTSQQHADAATRERAQQKVGKWKRVLGGTDSGLLNVGSRTPVADVPDWATLEVVTGGFATGELLAAGPLRDHEESLLDRLPRVSERDARRALNAYFLSDNGLDELRQRLRSGCYDVGIPEEGALLVVGWLVEHGHLDEAHGLLDQLAPYLPNLRFYPIPVERPRRFGTRVFVQDVGDTVAQLQRIKPNKHVLAQKEAIQVWIPLYDQTVALFLETIADGEAPTLRRDAEGNRSTSTCVKFPIEGGWPCAIYPDGWRVRAQVVLDDYDRLRRQHQLCGKPERSKESFAQLRGYLRQCVADPTLLSGRDVGRIRLILARYVAKRGVAGSETCRMVREKQHAQASAPTHHQVAQVVIPRLQSLPNGEGLDDVAAITQPVTSEEAERFRIAEGSAVPTALQRKVERCLSETVEELVERGVITSGETLARVLPQMTSGLRAAGISNPTLRQLYAAIYRAFRRRRSLLLLNLESQVKIEELPWVAAIDRFRSENLSTRELARQTLEEVTVLTLVSFPHVILPNKLLQELRALAKSAGLNLPLVDELAADIFMGEFSDKFRQAAVKAAELLQGTLYQKYYAIDFDRIRALPETRPTKRSWFARGARAFNPMFELCSARAGVAYGTWDPAINGMIIEQQQIVTTQNLAALFEVLDLANGLRDRLFDMAQRCFTWVCARQQVKLDRRHARLITIKNTAYAWRQMIFYLSLLPNDEVQSFVAWAREHLERQKEQFRARFAPAIAGLAVASSGLPVETDLEARRFLAWSKERHWLLD
jgi:hypothetical protein